MNMNGPAEIPRHERLATCYELANRLQEVYTDQIVAIGVYGSVSRGTDGPYSDIEMFCVLKDSDEEVDFSYEWSAGPWKAEVNVRSANVVLNDAATVEGDWPLTHGPFFSPLSLYDPDGFFPKLQKTAQSPTSEDFSNAISEVLVGEMYEFIGKLRNASRTGTQTYLPYLAMQFAQYGAMFYRFTQSEAVLDRSQGASGNRWSFQSAQMDMTLSPIWSCPASRLNQIKLLPRANNSGMDLSRGQRNTTTRFIRNVFHSKRP